ncbi:type I glyceraldehyde-3-phosphate dehydrogenase [Candidatus Kaiserbacteria bacterium RIFCSPHIGHO2_02_FULL_59_21]|uniref:Type I glyceraldehyde-3-phosphate dehydrogenase n=1 Tax=Candidatus Kaiserbacteria bacterium RIFCSPHIGHO2_02_FULL_59_21 TaxID=1798500 RepID=A0A1F6E0Q7_9BACT|nr:MAG: type I glyceraldehyde-3-phosphate dehydrogenase [Candidatus Kaiserbacteria bacterium RIFCSPHIGHO2_01_FULL_58_22]OGG67226.1 MAG: type I glyceraldehyde-3-phosphate dehydrogenase [Candidatus Kaiserbacteria bacterium RIFCSPHIGHO2_02_FULL_59_21]OGG79867.1 MAG: type I glyceraldehyde-3-phosphate dehydrogenase [Candidatus Kaiserbacteria bacterium RIFCSPLOWO2_01_FULL_59_34]OGG85512.1 MAG: type I glyceraldehyde-3-phosphate dehydrogenase [Candidatus Kaiserbacteria bacterium RIFCSPLOWO2_02_FULL_59_1
MIKIAINGFGRIGRGFTRAVIERGKMGGTGEIELVAINDLAPADNLAYLLKYDTVYGRAAFPIASEGSALVIDGKKIPILAEKDPLKLPWKDMRVDVVVESTGHFTTGEKAKAHLDAGAKRVVISAPGKGEGVETILIGANEEKFGTCDITSNASCTTNAASPIIGILDEALGIERALLNTVHAYTATQAIVDGVAPDDFRRGRAGAANIVPSSTGAAKATTLAFAGLKGKFDGIAVRVPVASGSLVDITFVSKKPTNAEEVNGLLKNAAASERWKRVFAVSEEPLVSSDILGLPYGAIADLAMTRVADGTLVKVLAWYDNEMGYVHTLIEHVLEVGKRL